MRAGLRRGGWEGGGSAIRSVLGLVLLLFGRMYSKRGPNLTGEVYVFLHVDKRERNRLKCLESLNVLALSPNY